MPNEQTTVPLFASGEILTAADMNLSAATGVPVFSNSTTRDAGFGGAGEKVLAEGQLCYLSSTNVVQYYDGAAWATVGPAAPGALTLIKSQVIGSAVSSVAVADAFSTTYDAYKIIVSGGAGSGANTDIRMTLGATATGYYYGIPLAIYSGGGAASLAGTNTTSWVGGSVNAASLNLNVELVDPFNTKITKMFAHVAKDTSGGSGGGFLDNTTSYTAFTLTAAVGQTFTGGTIYVYGYAKA
jgi:hypothetical protein